MWKLLKRIGCVHATRHNEVHGGTTTQTCVRCGKSWTFPAHKALAS